MYSATQRPYIVTKFSGHDGDPKTRDRKRRNGTVLGMSFYTAARTKMFLRSWNPVTMAATHAATWPARRRHHSNL